MTIIIKSIIVTIIMIKIKITTAVLETIRKAMMELQNKYNINNNNKT
jgi:hypothetical protein